MLQQRRCRTRAHAEAVPVAAAVPTCAASEAGAQLYAYAHQHTGPGVQTQGLHTACRSRREGATVACGAAIASRTGTDVWTGLALGRPDASHTAREIMPCHHPIEP